MRPARAKKRVLQPRISHHSYPRYQSYPTATKKTHHRSRRNDASAGADSHRRSRVEGVCRERGNNVGIEKKKERESTVRRKTKQNPSNFFANSSTRVPLSYGSNSYCNPTPHTVLFQFRPKHAYETLVDTKHDAHTNRAWSALIRTRKHRRLNRQQEKKVPNMNLPTTPVPIPAGQFQLSGPPPNTDTRNNGATYNNECTATEPPPPLKPQRQGGDYFSNTSHTPAYRLMAYAVS